MLNAFVLQYEKAVHTRRAAKEDEDFKTMKSRAVLSSVHPIEAKADMMPQLFVRDPIGPSNTKGRPKNATRIRSLLEMPKKDCVTTPLVVQKERQMNCCKRNNGDMSCCWEKFGWFLFWIVDFFMF
ncbi:unnamed protein product [Lactuca saligna]|uniref:Uncharacterized protein n=1 Tax=Lactuca saligna TaxID=75948 RepID=A0AA36DZT5_LACSI|nr:unnamed protein product [Lactuca saligna]